MNIINSVIVQAEEKRQDNINTIVKKYLREKDLMTEFMINNVFFTRELNPEGDIYKYKDELILIVTPLKTEVKGGEFSLVYKIKELF